MWHRPPASILWRCDEDGPRLNCSKGGGRLLFKKKRSRPKLDMTTLKDRLEPGQNTIAASREEPPASSMPVRGTQVLVTVSGLLLGMLLAAMDQTIVGTALPTMFRE